MSSNTFKWKVGWAIQFKRKDGTTFLACSGVGDQPAVFVRRNRKRAVEHKKACLEQGNLKGKIVPVCYADPVVMEKSK